MKSFFSESINEITIFADNLWTLNHTIYIKGIKIYWERKMERLSILK